VTSALSRAYRWMCIAVAATIVLMAAYIVVRISMLILSSATPATGTAAGILLAAELFVAFHAVAYFANVVKSSLRAGTSSSAFVSHTCAPVAVLITSFNEAEEVLEETLASVTAMDYPSVHVYLVDDSTRAPAQEVVRRLARKYGAELVHRENRAGYKAGAINDLLPRLDEPYIAVLDADQRPAESWLRETVPLLERQARVALVQAPQVYVNTAGLPVAEAAACQQAIFFEYICEGKSASNAAFCCGSNVVMRRQALLDIGVTVDGRRHYFDETTVTEDFATSVRLHMAGWETVYVNQTYVVGMGPETLTAYFTQQMRWAMGTMTVGLRVIGLAFRAPRRLRAVQWWEYIVSGTYYFVGFANLIFMAAPIAFLLLGFSPAGSASTLYLALFLPYFVLTMSLFFTGMRVRRYPLRGVWLATALSFSTFWIYVQAAMVALLGLKRAFAVTPKAVGGSIPTWHLLPQLLLFILTTAAAVVGVLRLIMVGVDPATTVTTIWAGYHGVLLSVLFTHFNRPVDIPAPVRLFEPIAHS
jgi:cellulose synthase (UDP-forming)